MGAILADPVALSPWQEWRFPYGKGAIHYRLDAASAWPDDLSAPWPPVAVSRDGDRVRWSVRVGATGGEVGFVRIGAPFDETAVEIAVMRAKAEADRVAQAAGLILG